MNRAKNKKIRVVLVDDHAIVRAGLRRLIEDEGDMEVIADVGDGRAAVTAAERQQPDIVIMDLSMPGLSGLDATREILGRGAAAPRVLCLSMHRERTMVGAVLQAGAAGYLLKDCAPRELVGAIHTVTAGKTFLSPSIQGDVVDAFVRGGETTPNGERNVTAREQQVLERIAKGLNTKEIASDLKLSEKTVAAHRLHLMDKLHLHSVADLTRYAIRRGIVEA